MDMDLIRSGRSPPGTSCMWRSWWLLRAQSTHITARAPSPTTIKSRQEACEADLSLSRRSQPGTGCTSRQPRTLTRNTLGQLDRQSYETSVTALDTTHLSLQLLKTSNISKIAFCKNLSVMIIDASDHLNRYKNSPF